MPVPSIGSRQIVEIFNILNEFMGNIFSVKYLLIRQLATGHKSWGLSVYKGIVYLFQGKRYALIVDESMIGSEKMLFTLAVAEII